MIEYQCTFCFNIKKAETVPDICTNCGTKNSDWKNLSTNEIERVEPPEKPIINPYERTTIPPTTAPKEEKPATPKVIIKTPPPKPSTIKTVPPTTASPIVISRKAGLSLSRNNIILNVPFGSNTVETIIIRNLNTGSVTGKATSNNVWVEPKPDTFTFTKYLFLHIHIKTKTATVPFTRNVTVRIESTSGDYDIKIKLNVIKITFFGGFRYLFRPWK